MVVQRLLILIVCISLIMVIGSGVCSAAAEIEWTADYRLLFDGTDYFGTDVDFVITTAALSSDGSMVAIGGYHETDDLWYVLMLPTNGAAGTLIAMPPDPDPGRPTMRIQNICIDGDGSRAFLTTKWYQRRIYKIEGGAATEIVDFADYAFLTMSTDNLVRSTADGNWAYFNEDRGDLFRVAHSGGVPEMVLDDASVTTWDGHPGWALGDFEISDDGSSFAFILSGYSSTAEASVVRYDAFAKTSGGVSQLTTDSHSETNIAMSGDGSTVAFKGDGGWTVAAAAGTGSSVVEAASYNVAGCELSGNGSLMVYADAQSNGGRLVPTDGSGSLDIFPDWSPIFLSAVYHFQINNNGLVVGFGATTRTYFVGRLDVPDATFPGPTIGEVSLTPEYLDTTNPSTAVLTMDVSHSGGLSDIQAVSADPMAGGRNTAYSNDLYVTIPFSPNDNGTGPDVTAGDGTYSATCDPAGLADTVGVQRIRTAAEDVDGNVRVVDVNYPSCPVGGCLIMSSGFESGGYVGWSAVVGG